MRRVVVGCGGSVSIPLLLVACNEDYVHGLTIKYLMLLFVCKI